MASFVSLLCNRLFLPASSAGLSLLLVTSGEPSF